MTIAVDTDDVENESKLPPGPYVRVIVSDTGTGMDAATLKRAVEPFFTTKGVGRGTGLGLSSVHGMAEQSGGDFKLTSKLGHGTSAVLRLPASESPPVTPANRSDESSSLERGDGLTVLLVDDEELVRKTTNDMLVRAGYAVVQAASGLQALDLLQSGLSVDMLITDHAMPGMSGVELIGHARAMRMSLPVLVISGFTTPLHDEPSNVPKIPKPFRQAELLQAVADLIKRTDL